MGSPKRAAPIEECET